MFAVLALRVRAGAIRTARDHVLSHFQAGRRAAVDHQFVAGGVEPVASGGRTRSDRAERICSPSRLRRSAYRIPVVVRNGFQQSAWRRRGHHHAWRRRRGGRAHPCLAAHFDDLRFRSELQPLRRHRGVRVRRDADVDGDVREAFELKGESHGCGRQCTQGIAADLIGDAGRENASILGNRDDRHARQHAAGLVRDHAVDAAGASPRRRRSGANTEQDEQNRDENLAGLPHGVPGAPDFCIGAAQLRLQASGVRSRSDPTPTMPGTFSPGVRSGSDPDLTLLGPSSDP